MRNIQIPTYQNIEIRAICQHLTTFAKKSATWWPTFGNIMSILANVDRYSNKIANRLSMFARSLILERCIIGITPKNWKKTQKIPTKQLCKRWNRNQKMWKPSNFAKQQARPKTRRGKNSSKRPARRSGAAILCKSCRIQNILQGPPVVVTIVVY